ncbi:MAG TPA: ScyD/ScyE family protein [Acidimicrobiia bacterium]|nr:ScyD/ScyE family protein [Acidimicrobiia bacterium]
MRPSAKRLVAGSVVVALLAIPALAGAVSGLAGPLFGLTTARHGTLLVADASVGILTVKEDQVHSTIPLPGVTDVSPAGNNLLWAVTGAGASPQADTGQALYRIWKGEPRLIVNLFEFETANNPDGHDPFDSNPYDVQALSSQAALVVDAGGNDLLKVNKNGRVRVLAVFPDEEVSTANFKQLAGCPNPPDPEPAPPCDMPDTAMAQAVPTSVTIGPDGYYYVGELKGFPGPTGESNIWRISPWASWAQCPSRHCVKVFDGGFTSIIDLAFHRGRLYVAELDEASWAAVEIFQSGVGGTISSCNVRRLTCRVVAEGIPQLTAITFDRHGNLWATRNSLVPGGAEVVKVD